VSSSEAGGGLEVEATGETVGEAKWSALRELERRFPGLDKAQVRFAVLSEGERGLLGVGHVPARVIAHLDQAPAAVPVARPAGEEPDSPAARLREFLERVCAALGAPAAIRLTEVDDVLTATLTGSGLGVVIGKRGQTIDAIQYLANAVVWHGSEERKQVVVDAAGYRERRQSTLEEAADRAAQQALAAGAAVPLEPMTAVERKIVHLRLAERGDVATESAGLEPNRYVVVRPAEE
jgi:spoIIIJ-associated protein